MKNLASLILLATLLLAPLRAGSKEEMIRLQTDVITTQNQVRLLQKSVDENGAITKTLLDQLLEKITKIGRQVEDMKGWMDEQQRSGDENVEDMVGLLRSLATKIDDQNLKIAGLTKRLDALQISLEEMRSRRPQAETGPDGNPLPLPPDQWYSLAYNDYIQGNYELAIQGFLDYLANYKDTELADNSQYYIGDCYFNQGKFKDAIEAFAQVTSLFPKGERAPAAYLKSGLAHLNLSENEPAVADFKNVIIKYPDSPEASIAGQQLQILGVELPTPKTKKRQP